MISFSRTLLPLALCLGIVTACNGPAGKKDKEAAAVLDHPPFRALTDSIDHHIGSDTAGLYFRRGELLSRNDRHELAVEDFRRAWEIRPDEMTGLRYSSELSIIGQPDDAIRLLQDCGKRFPGNPAFPGMLGELYLQSGRMTEALSLYDKVLREDSLNFEAWYEKGLILERTGDTTGAIEALGKAYTLQPINTYALELAHIYAESRNAAALPICDAVLKKDSTHALLDPLFIKGIYYSNTSQYKKAIVQFDSCIGRDWKFTDAYLEKGIALFREKDYDSAMSVFQMTIRVSNTYPDGYFWVGRCYEAKDQKQQAITYYRRALALDKDFKEAAERIKKLQ